MTLTPFAGPRDLYLIVIGVIVGVLLGPAVLGRIAPEVHRGMFGGAQAQQMSQVIEDSLSGFDEQTRDRLLRMSETGVSKQAVDEFRDTRAAERESLVMQLRGVEAIRDRDAMGLATAIVMALLATMVIEAAIAPTLGGGGGSSGDSERGGRHDAGRAVVPRTLPRLVTVRYGLAAAWVALVLARPGLLTQMPMIFTAILVVLALAVGLVPLGPGKPKPFEN